MALTSYIFHFEVLDTSSTAGVGLTGKTYSDFTVKYVKPGGTLTAMTTETITTLGTFQAPTSAAHIRIKELNSADPTKGIYEAHLSDSLLSSGSKVTLFFSVSGGKAQPVEIDLVDVKPTNVTQFGGTNGTFSGGRPEVNLTHWRGTQPGTLDSNTFVPCNLAAINGNTTRANNLASAADNYSATRGLAGTALPNAAAGAAGGIPTSVEFEARTLVAANYFDPATDTVVVGTNNDKSGYTINGTITTLDALDADQDSQHATTQGMIAAATEYIDTEVAAIKAKTDNLPSDPADQSAVEAAITAATSGLASQASVDVVDGIVDQILVDTAEIGVAGAGLTEAGGTGDQFTGISSVGAVAGAVTVGTNNDKTGYSLATAPPTAAAIADAVWAAGTRTLTGFGTLVSDIWASASRTLTAFAGFQINSDMTAVKAKTDNLPASPAATGDIPSADITAIKAKTDQLAFTVANKVDATATVDENAIATAVVAEIGGTTITVVSPVTSASTIELVQGDDYYHADSRALTFTLSGTLPAYTDATCILYITAGVRISSTGMVVTATGDTRVVRFELTATDTATLLDGIDIGTFDVQVTLSNGHVTTPAQGTVTVKRQQ